MLIEQRQLPLQHLERLRKRVPDRHGVTLPVRLLPEPIELPGHGLNGALVVEKDIAPGGGNAFLAGHLQRDARRRRRG